MTFELGNRAVYIGQKNTPYAKLVVTRLIELGDLPYCLRPYIYSPNPTHIVRIGLGDCAAYFNEEALTKGLPVNSLATKVIQEISIPAGLPLLPDNAICGQVVFVGNNGEDCDLPMPIIDRWFSARQKNMAYFSSEAADQFGSAIYCTLDGQKREVTGIFHSQERAEKDYLWKDRIFQGEITTTPWRKGRDGRFDRDR